MAERVYCLYRVSTNKQVDHDENNQADIPMQRKACHDFAAKMGWVIVGEEQETGVSGYKVSADDRDKLQLIKKYAEQGKFDILLALIDFNKHNQDFIFFILKNIHSTLQLQHSH